MTGASALAARWLIDVDVKLVTAAHLGDGEEGEFVDQEVLRGADGGPVVWGTSVAGLLREALCLGVLGDRVEEPKFAVPTGASDRRVTALFGSASGTEDGIDSALIIDDAPGKLPDGLAAEIRDGVAITPSTRIARDGMLYDREVWPSGTQFTFRLELPIRAQDSSQEAELLAGLALALELLEDGAVGLGARTTRGLGRVSIEGTRAQRYDLSGSEQWDKWFEALLNDRKNGVTGRQMPNTKEPQTPPDALCAALDDTMKAQFTNCLGTLREGRQDRRLEIEIPVTFRSGVLIRCVEATGPDVSHIQSGAQDILTSTAITGSLRQRARRIANVVRNGRGDADDWVVALFGSESNPAALPPIPGTPGPELDASRIRIGETLLLGGERLVVTRLRIDSFTQAPVGSALFQEEVLYGASSTLRLTLPLSPPSTAKQAGTGGTSQFDDALCGFVLLLVKDVLLGDVAIGGTSAVGRGWASFSKGALLTVIRDGEEVLKAVEADLFGDGVPVDTANEINSWVQEFHEADLPASFAKADLVDTQEIRR